MGRIGRKKASELGRIGRKKIRTYLQSRPSLLLYHKLSRGVYFHGKA